MIRSCLECEVENVLRHVLTCSCETPASMYHSTIEMTTEAEDEFPVPVDPPTVDVPVASQVTEAQVFTVGKGTRPRLPVVFYRLMPKARLRAVREYIGSFEYSLHPQTNFNSQKQRPLFLIMETAKSIITAPQPIKCVEAVFVALLLTAGVPDVERYPLSFQTVLDDQVYQHIVLLVQYFGKFGAFGISRWPEFMSKDLKFDSMSSIIENYKTCYEEQHHVVEKIRVGLPVEHNIRSTNFVCWRHLELDLADWSWRECCDAINEFSVKAKRLWNLWIRSQRGEDPWALHVRQTKRLLAGRKASPHKAKRLNSGKSSDGQARSSDLTAEAFENSGHLESLEFLDPGSINCRFDIQPLNSRGSARVTLSLESGLEPGEIPYPPRSAKNSKRAAGPILHREFCFNKNGSVGRSQSNHSKFRRKKFFKASVAQSESVAIRPVKSIRGYMRSLPRAAPVRNQSKEQPLVVSKCLLGNKTYLDGTPGFDGPKAAWECLRTVYRTKNEARLLLLKGKLANLRMEGPHATEAFHVMQDIFQQLVGIGEAITSKLDVFEGSINRLTENFDAVVQSVNDQTELHSLKRLAKQLAEESSINVDVLHPIKKTKGPFYEKILAAKRNITSNLKKMGPPDLEPHVHIRVPPCNWCGLHGHRMRDCQDLEKEIARRVREYKNQIAPYTVPSIARREESKDQEQQLDFDLQFKTQESSTEEGDSQRQNESTDQLVAREEMISLTEVDVDQRTTSTAQNTASTTSRKKIKMCIMQRRLRTKLLYLLGMDKPSPQLKKRRKLPQMKNS